MLKLKELDFNCWHQLAQLGEKEFFAFYENISAKLSSDMGNFTSLLELLNEPNNSGFTPVDVCMRSWKHESILRLFKLADEVDQLILSSNALHMIL